MSLVKQCIFVCTLRSICYVRIKIIIEIQLFNLNKDAKGVLHLNDI